MDIVPLFCEIDEFCCRFEPWLGQYQVSQRQRRRASTMYLSEVRTILVLFHLLGYRNLKQFYTEYVTQHLRWAFPRLVSSGALWARFVELQGAALLPLCAYLRTRQGRCTGISFIDATTLAVCHNRRIPTHRVFAPQAARGKGSLGWFYGFKLHLVVNDEGALLRCCLTPGNVDDRTPAPSLLDQLWGKLFADKGYLAQWLFDALFAHDLQLVTKLKKIWTINCCLTWTNCSSVSVPSSNPSRTNSRIFPRLNIPAIGVSGTFSAISWRGLSLIPGTQPSLPWASAHSPWLCRTLLSNPLCRTHVTIDL